jgi:FkbM family methyltransferase
MSEYFEFEKHGKKYLISAKNDHYGLSFWRNFSNMSYEPDTQALLEVFCNPNTVFMDIGAANGSMTILAASLGAKVWAYEPNPHVFQSLHSNIYLNPSLVDSVQLINKAVSIENSTLSTSSTNLSEVLTPIVFTEWSSQTPIEVISILDEVARCRELNPESEIVIKMDIEGAEWKILSSELVLESLQREKVVLILALHPGLHRPIGNRKTLSLRFRSLIWNAKNSVDAHRLYSRLNRFATIQRTNLNIVRRPIHFCLLILGGSHEFVIKFIGKPRG